MTTPNRWVRIAQTVGFLTLCLMLASATPADANSRTRKPKRPITHPKFDPDAEKVELFAGIDEGQFAARIVAKDANQGRLLIENKTDQPLTVEVPESLVAVHILKQFGGMGMGGGMGGMGGGMGGMGGGMGGMGGMGGGQSMGGGMGGMGGGMGGMGGGMGGMGGGMGGGGGFFSIPPEQIISLPFHSVCLEHGRPEPNSGMVYVPVPTDRYTDDPNLQALIRIVARGRLNPGAAQAAAWHITDEMSWTELALKHIDGFGGRPATPYFNRAQLFYAQEIVNAAVEYGKDLAENAEPHEGPTLKEIIREGRRTNQEVSSRD